MNRSVEEATGTIEIRQADWPADESSIRSVRQAVFVREQHIPAALEWDGRDPDCTHLLALTQEQHAVGTLRLSQDGRIGRMAVLKPYRHQGVASALLRYLLAMAEKQGMTTLFLNAQCQTTGIYQRFGFAPTGPVFEEAGIPHQRMQWLYSQTTCR